MSEPAKFPDWIGRDSWQLWEAVALISNVEPSTEFLTHLRFAPGMSKPKPKTVRLNDIVREAHTSAEAREAPWLLGRFDVTPFEFLNTPVNPDGFVLWALSKNFDVPDELQPWRQHIDSREAEETDRARLDELAESDAAGRLVRRRAARKLGLHQLSHWLTAEEIAELYGDEDLVPEILEDFHRRRLRYCLIRGRATLQDQDSRTGIWRIARNPDGTLYHVGPGCDGLCVHVGDFLAWPARLPIPEGEAGELVRAWLGMAAGEAAAVPEPEPAENTARVVALPVPPRQEPECRKRKTWASVLRRAIQSALNEWERRNRGDADVYQFVRDSLEQDARFDWRPTDTGALWSYPTEAGAFKEIRDASLCKNIRREIDRRAKQSGSDTVRTDGHCADGCPAVS